MNTALTSSTAQITTGSVRFFTRRLGLARTSPACREATSDAGRFRRPNRAAPGAGQPRVVLLKPLITSPLIDVGEFSYYDDPDDPTAFETRNVLYHYGPEMLMIGKFCALGEGVRFIMNGANHRMDGPSTFPFPIMGGSWAATSTSSPACLDVATPWWATMSGSATRPS